MKGVKNGFRRFCAIVLGAVFVISGILKLMDPVGAGLVVDEYWKFLHLGFLHFSSKAVGIILALAEAVTGVALVTGVWRRIAAVSAACLLTFFTLLTVVLVIFNPSMDCGCFGEALHLTHLQSLIKNIVLDALAAGAFLPFRDLGEPRKIKYGTFGLVTLSIILFGLHCLISIPIKEFTDFKVGRQLLAAHDERSDIDFEAVFIYEKNGRFRSFSLESLPDSTWKFITARAKPSFDPFATANLAISNPRESDADGFPLSVDSLAAVGNVVAVSFHNPEKMKGRRLEQARAFLDEAAGLGYVPLLLVSSSGDIPDDALLTPFKSAVSLNRSNGGATLIQDGYIIRKWPAQHLPDRTKLQELLDAEPMESMIASQTRGDQYFQAFLLYSFALLAFL